MLQLNGDAALLHNRAFRGQDPVVKLNLGCGHVQPPGWVNVDGSKRAWLASTFSWLDRALIALRLFPPTEFNGTTMWADLLKPFPWPDGSVDAIYLGEILEHFTSEQGEHVIVECRRVLRPGGALRIRVPDHAAFWQNYLRDYSAMKGRHRAEWNTDHTRWTAMFFADICVRRPSRWQSIGHFHKWMYDDISLILLLERVGFIDVERKTFRQSRIGGIEEVEERDDLIVEGTCP